MNDILFANAKNTLYERISKVEESFMPLISLKFDQVIEYLKDFELQKSLIVSLTCDNSIYFRFYTSSNFEIHLEVYYDQEEIDNKEYIESIVTIYQDNKSILQQFGDLEIIFQQILKIILHSQ